MIKFENTYDRSTLMLYVQECFRSGNVSEVTWKLVRDCLEQMGTRTLSINPGCHRVKGYYGCYNSKPRDKCLSGEIFSSMKEVQATDARNY